MRYREYLFPESVYGDFYIQEKLASEGFIQVLSSVIKKFGCAEYRFRHDLPESTGCSNGSSNRREAMPFVSGQFTTNRIEAVIDDQNSGVSFHAYLKSTDEKSLKSAFGSVHELGTFFGKLADRRSLVLSIDLQTYQFNAIGFRGEKINKIPYTYFAILPKARMLLVIPQGYWPLSFVGLMREARQLSGVGVWFDWRYSPLLFSSTHLRSSIHPAYNLAA